MSVLRFGTRQANMLDPNLFGFGSYLPDEEPGVLYTPTRITLVYPSTGARLSIVGNFDDSSEYALLYSPVNAFALETGTGELLFEWSALSLTLADVVYAYDLSYLAESLLGGSDSIIGSTQDDFLFGDFPEWHEELVVANPLAPGEHLAMSADASTLAGVVWRELVPGDSAQMRQEVVLIDPDTGGQQLMSVGGSAVAGAQAQNPTLSMDGGTLVFRTSDPAFGGTLDPFPVWQVIARDTAGGSHSLVSSDVNGVAANEDCEGPVVSADGSRAAFTTMATNLVDMVLPLYRTQVYSKDLETGAVALVSSNAAGEPADRDSFGSAMSMDGRYVAFASLATNLVSEVIPLEGTNLFVKDLLTGEVSFVAPLSVSAFIGEPDELGLAMSLDGRVVAFMSSAPDLVAGDTNNEPDVFVKYLDTGEILRISVDEYGQQSPAGARSSSISMSADGAVVAFHTNAGGLAGGAPLWGTVYVMDLSSGDVARVSDFSADIGWTPVALSADGTTVAFTQTVGGAYSPDPQLVVSSLHGQGADTLAGGAGDDVYFVETHDAVFEQAGQGDDTLITVQSEFVLPLEVESLLYGGHGFFTAIGNASGNLLSGGAMDDELRGQGGNDTLAGNPGNDLIDGGQGRDESVYDGSLHDFTVQRTIDGHVARDLSGAEGFDTLTGVEDLVFSDFSVNLTVQDSAARLTAFELHRLEELYVAFFNRTPDADGLEYWIDQYAGGTSINVIADVFYDAGVHYSDLTGYLPGMSHQDFVRKVYGNVLGRSDPSDTDLENGVRYWAGLLERGEATRGTLVTEILYSAHQFKGDLEWGWVSDLLDNKIVAADTLAVAWGLNFASPDQSIEMGMAIAAAVTPQTADDAIALVGIDPGQLDLV